MDLHDGHVCERFGHMVKTWTEIDKCKNEFSALDAMKPADPTAVKNHREEMEILQAKLATLYAQIDLDPDGRQTAQAPCAGSPEPQPPDAKPQDTTPTPAVPVVTESAPVGVEPVKATTVDKGYLYKKAVLIRKLTPRWASIESDFQHADENGLRDAAKATKHGEWFENPALDWARKNGKLTDTKQQGPVNSVFDLPGKKYTTKN